MIYDYYCDKCDKVWEETHSIADRDKPVGQDCPCGKGGKVQRGISAPGLSFEGSVGTIKKAGGEWNNILKTIKKNSGSGCTIEHD